jgi:hypothetical protein
VVATGRRLPTTGATLRLRHDLEDPLLHGLSPGGLDSQFTGEPICKAAA